MQHNTYRYQLQSESKLNGPLKILLVVSGLFTFAFGMFSPIYALFVEEIGGDIITASNAWAVFSLVAGLATFIVGSIENKLKETEMGIVGSQFVLGLAYIAYYFTDGVIMLYISQAILGLGMAIFWPAFHSVYGRHVEKKEAAWQWSLYDGLAYIVPAVAAVGGGWLARSMGFGIVFLIMAIVSFGCGIFIWVLPRRVL